MERRESLGLSIDGEAMTISGEGRHRNRDVGSSGKVSETAIYLVEPELICRIAAAASVAVRIYGAMLPT